MLVFPEGQGWLFPSTRSWCPEGREGTPLRPGQLPIYIDGFSRHFRKDLKLAGLPQMKYKNLRHTAAQIFNDLVDENTARLLLGHTKASTTRKHYLDLSPITQALNNYRLDKCDKNLFKLSEVLRELKVAA